MGPTWSEATFRPDHIFDGDRMTQIIATNTTAGIALATGEALAVLASGSIVGLCCTNRLTVGFPLRPGRVTPRLS